MKTDTGSRRSLLSGLAAGAAALLFGSKNARAQTAGATPAFQPARHEQDDWMNGLPGKHRNVIDCAAAPAAATGIFYADNILAGNRNGYGLVDSDVAVIVVLRYEATAYAYNDAIWSKYGSVFGKMVASGDAPAKDATANPLNASAGGPGNATASGLAARGVHYGICSMATNRIAGEIASAVGSTLPEIYKELAANLLPNGHLVAAGVVAINRAQEYGYTLLTAG